MIFVFGDRGHVPETIGSTLHAHLLVKRDTATTQKQSHRSRVVYLSGVASWSPIVIVVAAAGHNNLAK